MFCGECGTQNPDTNQFCKNCGTPLRKAQPSAVPGPATPAPVEAYPPPPPSAYVPPQQVPVAAETPAVAKPPLNKGLFLLDILSILVGAVSWFLYPYICGILAMVFGGVVLYKSRSKKGTKAIIVAVLGILGILIGLGSIVVNLFYFSFFPPVPVTF